MFTNVRLIYRKLHNYSSIDLIPVVTGVTDNYAMLYI